jgi:Domain of unknown function (DUF4123)
MTGLFGLVDCSRDPGLIDLVKLSPAHACLFEGQLDPSVEAVSPFIVNLSASPQLAETWRSSGWGQSWGVIVYSDRELIDLRRHFRHFLLAALPDTRRVIFRFYDPRVLRTYLTTCVPEELAQWFEPVDAFVLEGEQGGSVTYRFDGESLRVS